MIRRNNFIDKGFGFEYLIDEITDYELFLLRHNNPVKIIEGDLSVGVYSYQIVEIEYDSIIVTFRNNDNGTLLGKKYTTILTKIDSKKNINYLYDIKHGLSIYALEEIIGKIESDKWNFLNMIILHN